MILRHTKIVAGDKTNKEIAAQMLVVKSDSQSGAAGKQDF